MGFRFFKRIQILPGIYLNLSKNVMSFSIGITGAKVTTSKKGIWKTIGIPGTGMYYTTYKSFDDKKK